MEHSTLQDILGVEREIREQLDAERARASQWLEDARREIDAAHREELQRVRQEAERRREAVQSAAAGRADRDARDAEARAAAVDRWSDEELRRVVRERIAVIVPGTSRAR